MRKLIITGMAVAMLAVPAAASADVAVNDQGVGTIGKGDVQTALGYANDGPFQADAKNIKFSVTDTTSMIWGVKCAPVNANGGFDYPTVGIHEISVNAGTESTTANTVNAMQKGKDGKVTGFNLTGITPGMPTWVGDIDYRKPTTSCPAGEHFYQWINAPKPFESVTTSGVLTVSNGVKTAELPNTPVL